MELNEAFLYRNLWFTMCESWVNNITEESIRKNIAEIKDSSEKTISEVREIAKGAISGMINGAKDAMKKDS